MHVYIIEDMLYCVIASFFFGWGGGRDVVGGSVASGMQVL
jgi:hypothetical protein